MSHNKPKGKISTAPYKGVRDFYPEDQFTENYIFGVWKKTAEEFGYKEYSASVLEPIELYLGKTSEEIVNDQTYTFTDRGGREVVLRPEMTPTVARMIAAKKRELILPLRWFSIPNLFRYEKPQRGRLREHWQLNVDAFGLTGKDIEIEIISLAHSIMKKFGLLDESFEIRISDREGFTEYLKKEYGLDSERTSEFLRLLDKKDKINDFDQRAKKLLGKPYNASAVQIDSVNEVVSELSALGIKNAKFDSSIVRGFDYYTGLVFEMFDTNPKNNRSLFGGGRYDKLVEMFGENSIPAIGFGMGDVTMKDTLESYGLLPQHKTSTTLYLCALKKEFIPKAQILAGKLRKGGLSVEVDMTEDKVGNQIKRADKKGARFIICLGENEITSKQYLLKELETGKETSVAENEVADFINK